MRSLFCGLEPFFGFGTDVGVKVNFFVLNAFPGIRKRAEFSSFLPWSGVLLSFDRISHVFSALFFWVFYSIFEEFYKFSNRAVPFLINVIFVCKFCALIEIFCNFWANFCFWFLKTKIKILSKPWVFLLEFFSNGSKMAVLNVLLFTCKYLKNKQ